MVAGCSLPVPKSWGTNLRDLSEQEGERLRERGGGREREGRETRRVRERCGKLRRDRECRPEEENERDREREREAERVEKRREIWGES